ncbi:hypothetical protein D5086_004684 [Populus alba]|uniref:Uncharacterized protein n=1 Tax=Populus alba TaxID=43335 RepID=A0ACC4CR73_POPAL
MALAMASLTKPRPPLSLHALSNPISLFSSPAVVLSFPFNRAAFASPSARAIKTGSDSSDLLRKPIAPSEKDLFGISEEEEEEDSEGEREEEEEEGFVDWEDRILEDTVPLVGFVRMILHSDKYESGDRLSQEHERTIVDRLLAHHPDFDNKIGCGIDYITPHLIANSVGFVFVLPGLDQEELSTICRQFHSQTFPTVEELKVASSTSEPPV